MTRRPQIVVQHHRSKHPKSSVNFLRGSVEDQQSTEDYWGAERLWIRWFVLSRFQKTYRDHELCRGRCSGYGREAAWPAMRPRSRRRRSRMPSLSSRRPPFYYGWIVLLIDGALKRRKKDNKLRYEDGRWRPYCRREEDQPCGRHVAVSSIQALMWCCRDFEPAQANRRIDFSVPARWHPQNTALHACIKGIYERTTLADFFLYSCHVKQLLMQRREKQLTLTYSPSKES